MTSSDSARWWLATLGLTAARLWLAAWVPLGDDEGYYWVWSRHPAASYYDHPPLVAWLVALSTHTVGDSLLALRLPFVICGTLAALALRALVDEATGDSRLAARSSLVFQVVPVFFALGFMVIPDTPLLLCWFLAGRAALRLERRPHAPSAVLLGLAFGCAALSKYIAALLMLSVAGFLRLRSERKLIAPFTVALVIALLMMSPVVWWNAGHDWASFHYQFASRHRGAHVDLARLMLYLGSQALYLSPLLLLLVGAAVVRARPWRAGGDAPGDRLLWWLGAPTACAFLAAAAFTNFKPNWAAPGYGALVALALREPSRWRERAPRLARGIGVAAVGVAMACTVLPIAHLRHPVLPLPAGADPTVDMMGWPAIAAHAEGAAARIRSQVRAAPVFAAGRYQLASRLEFYLRGHPEVVSLDPGRDAYDDWQHLESLRGRNLVFIASDRFPTPPDQLVGCDSTRVFSRLTVAIRRHEQFHVTVYEVWGCRPGAPSPRGADARPAS